MQCGNGTQGIADAFNPILPLSRRPLRHGSKELHGEVQPPGGGVNLLLRHGEVPRAYVLIGVKTDLLEADDLPVHPHVAMDAVHSAF